MILLDARFNKDVDEDYLLGGDVYYYFFNF